MATVIRTPTTAISFLSVTLLLTLIATAAMAQSVQSTATYRERMALPPGAVFEATLEDVSRADAPADVIARTPLTSPGNPPIAFTIACDSTKISTDRQYVVRARILLDHNLLFTSDTATPVITRGNPTSVAILLRRVGAGQPPNPPARQPLEGTYWKATELAGKPLPAQDAKREAHLVFQATGRLAGSDGCNQISGSYELKGDSITFGKLASTQMACANVPAEIERGFRNALMGATRLAIAGDRLDLFDGTGKPLAAFSAQATATSADLRGTSWQLVKFQGGDDKTLTPDDRSKYTIEFASDARLNVGIDCNRGRGTWKSSGANQLQFGPLALTRAKCPPGSLHDQIVKQWSYIRSFVIKDGHLFLSLMADGGIYEFEPLAGK